LPLYQETRAKLLTEGYIYDLVSCFVFEKEGSFQHIAHALKYNEYKSMGVELGKRIGPLYTSLSISVTLKSANGRFSVANPVFNIPSMDIGKATASWQITGVSAGPDTFTISVSGTNPHKSVQFTDSYSPSGVVTVTAAPQPTLNTVTITITDSASSAKLSGVTATLGGTAKITDVNGQATFSIAAGTYPLTISKTGYGTNSENFVVSTNVAISRLLTATPPSTPSIRTVSITVSDSANSTKLSGATVTLGTTIRNTDTNGVATFSIASGTYPLTIIKGGYGSKSENLVVSASLDITRTLTATTNIQITIDMLTVTVVDSANNVVSGAVVTIGTTSKTTDANGAASFELPHGTYLVAISKNGYQSRSESLTVSTTSSIKRTITNSSTPQNPTPVTTTPHDDDDQVYYQHLPHDDDHIYRQYHPYDDDHVHSIFN
jgi:hypothetical protein